MNMKQRKLLIAASDLLASLSKGTHRRAILHAEDRAGGGYSSTVCVGCKQIKDLSDAVEALYPNLPAMARAIRIERRKQMLAELEFGKIAEQETK